MPARRLRVRIDGVQADLAAALADGRFDLVTDGTADVHLCAVDGTHPAGGSRRTRNGQARDGSSARRGYQPDQPGGALTPREQQVLERLAGGATNRQIAQGLYIADNTVKNHVRSILLKLDCQSRTEAVVTAHHLGLIEL